MSKDNNSSEKAKSVVTPADKAAVVTKPADSESDQVKDVQSIEGAEDALADGQEQETAGETGGDEQEPQGDDSVDDGAGDPSEEAVVGSTVETAGSLPPAPIVAPVIAAPVVVPPSAPAPPQATLQANDGDSATLEVFRHRLDEYIKHMSRGVPVSSDAGAAWQKKLFTIIDQILKLQGTVFNRAWSDLLAKVAANRQGAFHESMAFRFFDKTKVDKVQLRNYQNLIHLIVHTSVPKSRAQMLKLIDITSVTKNLQIPGAADKLYAYYNL